jgi:hypothetical protein
MGHGSYSHDAHKALIAGRVHQAGSEVFAQSQCHALMNPKGLKVRECRDSAAHPNSLGVIFALDVTGSMGDIPELLAKQELPKFMQLMEACEIPDPQLLFMAIGDATSDQAALQVGQFESTAELMDQWLTWSYLEGGGGGSGEESYELAFYVAAQHTDTDNWAKRKKKGYLFVTGDELPYPYVSRHQIDSLLGAKLDEDIPIAEVIAAASETYHLFFLIPDLERKARCEARWVQLLGDHTICMESPADACVVAALIVAMTERPSVEVDQLVKELSAAGIESTQISSSLRAVKRYAQTLNPNLANGFAQTKVSTGSWWSKIFG